ncbi:hypothetical protein SHKM778_63620 [Streptomyces sp. KM77-8]|uniref:Nicotinate-nucleotide--dimethylbenzimidazole phosphoribosyltransferase n=1 Tax=Streptomyces haneummycinicus TaxID=3074435 RepID=A0AAT9HRI7_9ACTN
MGVSSDLPATPGLLPRKIRAGTSDMTTGPAMTREEAKKAIEVGIETARDLVAAGNKALLTGEMGIANTTASAALISVFTGADPAEVTGRGTGINDETLARKTEVVRRALELHQPDPADPIGVLAAVGGFEHAAIVGLLLGGASLRTPVILDGVSAGAAALVARAIAPEVLAACIAGHRSAEPGHVAALNKLGLRPWSTSTSASAKAPAPSWPSRWSRARPGPCTRWRPSTRRESPKSRPAAVPTRSACEVSPGGTGGHSRPPIRTCGGRGGAPGFATGRTGKSPHPPRRPHRTRA